ncbi:threonine-phosphate decarboxylase CobD [Rhodocyclaceae bacterium]
MLEHGGRLREAAQRWGIPCAAWLDLSTGIAPWPYPVPAVPAAVWQRLPEADDGLEAAARAYYGTGQLLALPGSQAGIQCLPRLLKPGRVAIPMPIYAEHPAAWRAAGHTQVGWDEPADYALLCNPNNPTGQCFTPAELLERARALRLLVVDEAFIDAAPEASLASCTAANIVVLRSPGKFFGLAGARTGFAIAAPALLAPLAEALGPWAVSHPARWAARHALADSAWQALQRTRLAVAAKRLADLLGCLGTPTGTALFQYVATPRALELHGQLAQRAILVRHFDTPAALRFGLPESAADWHKLASALKEIA